MMSCQSSICAVHPANQGQGVEGGREGGRRRPQARSGERGGGHRQEHERKKSLGFPQMHQNIEPMNLIHTPGPDSGSGGGGGFLATSVLPIENYFL